MADTRTRPTVDRPARPGRRPPRKDRALDPRQRSRKRFARRQWARRWLTWKYVVAGLALLLALGGGIYLVFFSTTLSVSGVDVVGTDTLTDAQVEHAADVPLGGPLATADLGAITTRVRSLAAVADVDVSREWPDQIRIDVTERTPVAVVEIGGQLRSLDAEGVVFGSYRTAPPGLPRVESASGTSGDALKEAATVAAALPASVRTLTDHVEVQTVDDISLALRDGRTVVWGSAEASDLKAEVLLDLLKRPAATYDVSVPAHPTTSGSAPS